MKTWSALLYFLIFSGGTHIVVNFLNPVLVALILLTLIIISVKGSLGFLINWNVRIFALATAILGVLQLLTLGLITEGYLLVPINILLSYYSAEVLKYKEQDVYNVLVGLAAISIAFFSMLNWLNIDLGYVFYFKDNLDYVNHNVKNFIVYSQKGDGSRNCGPFWEPGAFAIYLNMAIYLGFLLKRRGYLSIVSILILIIAVITTKSTAGYFILLLNLLYALKHYKRVRQLRLIIVFALSMVALWSWRSVPFLSEKVSEQIYRYNHLRDNEFSNERLGALKFDLHYIKKHPLIGNGIHETTRYADHEYLIGESLGHSNGLSNFFAQYGLVFAALIAFLFFRGSKVYFHFWFIVLSSLFTEPMLNYPLFLFLAFITYNLESNANRSTYHLL